MNQRENFFAMLNGEKPEYVPCFGMFNKFCVLPTDPESPATFGGTDGFGVEWVVEGLGAIPKPGKFLFEDMTDWKKCVKFPDLDNVDYDAMAAMELADFNREEQVLTIFNGTSGMFTRMNAMMGFENALIALVTEPEACREFGEAFAEYQIKHHNKIIDAYHPDIIWYADDLAHSRGLFMSPETYYNVISPYNKKIVEAIAARGVIVDFHCCGKCESILDDFVAMGARMWNPANTSNNIEAIQKKFGNRLIIDGGWDSQGQPGYVGATEQDLCNEVERCIKTYGKNGNYVLMPLIVNEKGNALIVGDERLPAVFAKVAEVGNLC